jgi:DNA-binding transcriptional MerR regulator
MQNAEHAQFLQYEAASEGEAQARAVEPVANPAHDEPSFTIGDLAREFGVSLRALRFYENKGLLAPRRAGLARLYSPSDRQRLILILKGKKLGFTLTEIRQMVAAEEGQAGGNKLQFNREKCQEQIRLLEQQKAEIEEGLAELRRIYASFEG